MAGSAARPHGTAPPGAAAGANTPGESFCDSAAVCWGERATTKSSPWAPAFVRNRRRWFQSFCWAPRAAGCGPSTRVWRRSGAARRLEAITRRKTAGLEFPHLWGRPLALRRLSGAPKPRRIAE